MQMNIDESLNIQEVVAVIDRSGSMAGKESDTVGGINSMFKELKTGIEVGDKINISIKFFDHEQILKYRSIDINEYTELTVNEFIPRGQTALLDAIGDTLAYFMEKKLMNKDAFTSCLIYVATDGLENASKSYTREKIKKMIETAKSIYNIEVLYLGANQDAILEAGNIGISPDSAINYDETSENINNVYRSVAGVVKRARTTGEAPSFTQLDRQSSQATNSQLFTNQNNAVYPKPPLIRRQTDIRLKKPSPLRRTHSEM